MMTLWLIWILICLNLRILSLTSVNLVWSTPDGDRLIAYMARVSNPNAAIDQPSDRLIKYLLDHQHVSPFEMVNLCVQINTTRDISRQILRHRSFQFQEFSGRYSVVEEPFESIAREGRLQDHSNRQNSLPLVDHSLSSWWTTTQNSISKACFEAYNKALENGLAKEVARVLLPEGLVPTKMYMNGTIRSWIHYINVRTGPETQKEHREVAEQIKAIFIENYPETAKALNYV